MKALYYEAKAGEILQAFFIDKTAIVAAGYQISASNLILVTYE